ncbi:MAG: hypothetical protein Tsb0020_38860 [Haliangiales bacterium]
MALTALIALMTAPPCRPGWADGGPQATQGRPAQVTLYAFFATWCVPCRAELPHLERLYRSYRERGLRVVLVSQDAPSTLQNVPAFLARFEVTAPWVADTESALLSRYNPAASLPYTVLVDARDVVLYAHAGYEPGDERRLEAEVVSALALSAGDAAAAAADDGPAGDRGGDGDGHGDGDDAASELSDDVSPGASGDISDHASVGARRPVAARRFELSSQGFALVRERRFDPDPARDGRLQAAVGRLELRTFSGRDSASVRIDAASIRDRSATAKAPLDRRVSLERVQLEAGLGRARFHLGDDYVAFGHGVSLSLRRIDPLGVDTSLRAGRIDWLGQRVRVTALAGFTNPQDLDPIQLRLRDDASDFIGGAALTFLMGARSPEAGAGGDYPVALGPYALHVSAPAAAADGGDVQWNIAGGAATYAGSGIRVAVDGAVARRVGLNLAPETGYALYGSLQRRLGPVTLLLDGKLYRHWQIGRLEQNLLYHEPPTLEREDQEVPGNEDAVGARVRGEWLLSPGLTAYANLLGYRYTLNDQSPLTDAALATHGYVGVAGQLGRAHSAGLALGYRREQDAAGNAKLTMWHVDVDGTWALGRGLALTAKWNHREETEVAFAARDLRRGLAVFGVSLSGWGALSALYGYSTEVNTTPTHYPGAELSLHLPRGSTVRLFAGSLVGGRVCVSGTCRDVPPFRGARLDLILRL